MTIGINGTNFVWWLILDTEDNKMKAKKNVSDARERAAKAFLPEQKRFEEYAKLRGIPLEDVLVECFNEYIAAVVHPARS
jgi:hypothetical protein